MIILKINPDGMFAFKSEGESPVRRDPYGISPRLDASQGMEVPAGQIHVGGLGRTMQPVNHASQARQPVGVDTACIAGSPPPAQATVSDTLDHQ